MKKLFPLVVLCLTMALGAKAQIVISSDFIRNSESKIKIRLVDSLTNDPLVMASVYLQPKGDTTIMYFNLTDTSGLAVLDKVVRGNYRLTAEYMGYKPFVKDYYFSQKEEKLGTVRMMEDATMLEAAKVVAAGNAIEVKQDTLIYNASMFRTADNAVLGELLKKMPGFEVSSSGQVKVNGESVSKITVNGKTFFFDDPTMAVNNLPAKIVDKIKITDLKSDKEKSTGISDMTAQKEKEMDISLKKEYEKGWFGNAKLAAGAPISPATKNENMLVGGKDFMYNGNVMLSGYNEKDQITIIANANNVPNTGANDMVVVMYGNSPAGPAAKSRPANGLTSSRQAGANINTSRIKGLETSIMANYKGALIESEEVSRKQTFRDNLPDINSNKKYSDNYNEDAAAIQLELKNTNTQKVYFRISPKFNYTGVKRTSRNDVETLEAVSPVSSASGLLNSSKAANYRESNYFMQRTDAYVTVKNLGKKGRNLTFDASFYFSDEDAASKEFSTTFFADNGESSIKDLFYKSSENGYGGKLYATYIEPLGKSWNMSLSAKTYLETNDVVNDAYNRSAEDGSFTPTISDKGEYTIPDSYYSSVSNYKYLKNSGELLAQYKKGMTTVQFGAAAEAVNNENYSRSYGISRTAGKGEWLWNFAPFLRFSHNAKNGAFIMARYSGSSSALRNSLITPAPDIADPTNISIGNVWLEPEFTNTLTLMANYNNKKNFSSFNSYIFLDNSTRSIVYANWFDANGVQYNVPVNSQKARNALRVSININSIPLDEKGSLKIGGSLGGSFSQGYSYQNISKGESIDMDTFDYSAFMEQFWGDASGNRFYSGQSGFKESRTTNSSYYANLNLLFKTEYFFARLGGNATRRIVKYSLNDAANMKTWDYSTSFTAEYTTKNKFNFITDITYSFYDGYTGGYGEPVLGWNFEAAKSINAITIGLKVKDILNRTTNFSRNVTGNYVEDSYRNVIGRHFLISLTWNFGKMNSGKNRSAQNAMINMMM